ncbi:MAG: hypothetical protein WAO74_02700 [Polaribacter sp.]|uniref:hypothetical protein n=1 Tax=Polaribacter sp. TaxID=1920175 RepID=UPI003BB10BD9
MKNLMLLFTILLTLSCTTNNEILQEEITEITPKKVEIILTTSKLIFDEIVVSYYDFDADEWVFGPGQFSYDSTGKPEPMIILLADYAYKMIEGEAYRKNNLDSSLKVQIYINDVLVFEDEATGTDLAYAHVNYDFTIEE